MEHFRHSHEPTDAQKEAGNYKKKSIRFAGMDISIENPAGTVRSGIDPSGHRWHSLQHFDYGYILRTLGADGDHVDCYVGLNEEAEFAYLITTRRPPEFTEDDEQKVMLGFDSEDEAVGVFMLHYDDERFLGDVLAMPIDEFKVRVCSADGALITGDVMLFKSLGPGERWVTAHPNGEGSKGVAILIQEHPDGTASVIGGAGGKLNHLKLRGVKPQSSYKESLAEKQRARQDARKEQVEQDKASGVYGQKQVEREKLKTAMQSERDDFVNGVAELAGWDAKDLEFDETAHASLTPAALEQARGDHKKALFKRAKDVVELNRRALVEDADKRAASGLGTVPLETSDADVLSVADLAPLPEVSGAKLGFNPQYAERSGMDASSAKAEAATALGEPPKPEKTETPADAAKATAKDALHKELEQFRKDNPDTMPPNAKVLDDATKAASMLKLHKRMKLAEKKARDASRALDDAETVEPKAMVLDVSDADVEEAARAQMEEDVRTAGTRSFLKAAENVGGDSKLAGHVGAGAFNALNSFAMTVGGDSLIDRSVVDVLGVAGAAKVLARRISSDMGPDADKVREAMELFHMEHYEKTQTDAVAKAQEYHDAAAAIELPDAENGADLLVAQAANDKRRQAVAEGQRVLGQAMGEMQANAALVSALGGKADHLEVNLGMVKPEAGVIQLRAIGLQPGDYELAAVGGQVVAHIKGEGLDRLAKPIDREGMAQVRRNLDIIGGSLDEDGWLPLGVANRPDLSMHVEPGVAERLSKPFAPSGDLKQSLQDYVGGRMADGDSPIDILADVQSADFFSKAGDPAAYRDALDNIAPLKGADGKMKPVESLRDAWEKMADDFVSKEYGGERAPIHKQSFDVDEHSNDALHRALAETPEGVAAYKSIGDLTAKERNGLRNWWAANVSKDDPQAAELHGKLNAHLAQEPADKETTDLFGETVPNPEHQQWTTQRDTMNAQLNDASLGWGKYVAMLGSPEKAIEAVQDLVRSRVTKKFAEAYNTLKPDAPLKLGKVPIRNALDHLDAVDPAARSARAAKEAQLHDSLRERSAGKYASGSTSDKVEQAKQSKAAFEQSQMGFFSTEDAPAVGGGDAGALGADERHTVGHAAEQKIAGMMSVVGQNFRPGKPAKLWNASMTGGNNYARQRLIKLLESNKRVMAAFGVGSGKSLLQLAGYTHLHEKGKVKRGVILAPSIVQGQFGGEAVRYLEPGKYKIHAEPGASRDERLAAYRDPATHLVVATHQSFRDDMIHLGAKHAGIPESEMADRLQKMTPEKRAEWSKSVCDTEGFKFDYMSVDESQYTLNREGKENSGMANVTDAFGDNSEYYMPSSGDPAKNDASEVFDMLSKMDRKRYTDRASFMRKYGGDTVAAKDALKREMARYFYPSRIDPDVKADRQTVSVKLNDKQNADLAALDKDVSAVRISKMNGELNIEALKRLAPERFEGVPDADHADVAAALQKSVGLLKNAATKRIIHSHPEGALLDTAASYANARRDKPGVVFAHSLEAVKQVAARLEKEGHRVVVLTGADSTSDKDKKKLEFNPEAGDAKADIIVASDAAATGMNLQRGRWEMQMDTPDTAMTHGQRQGRINRTGQKNDIELADLVVDHPSVHRSRDRLKKKYGLRELMTSPLDGLDDTGLAWFLKQKFSGQEALA